MTLLTIALVYLGVAGVWALTRCLDRHGPRTSAQAEYEAFAAKDLTSRMTYDSVQAEVTFNPMRRM